MNIPWTRPTSTESLLQHNTFGNLFYPILERRGQQFNKYISNLINQTCYFTLVILKCFIKFFLSFCLAIFRVELFETVQTGDMN